MVKLLEDYKKMLTTLQLNGATEGELPQVRKKKKRKVLSADEKINKKDFIPPRYDSIFREGIEWLNSL